MSRFVPIALVAALLIGTAAAFAITERLKLEKTPIMRPDITRVFSWRSEDPEHARAEVNFRLRKADRVTVEIVQGDDMVARLASGVRYPASADVQLSWDGRDSAGEFVDAGRYRPRVHLERAHRTIVIPNPIQVDLTAPETRLVSARPRVISPDHDGRAEFVRVRFRVDEAARGLLLVDGRQQLKSRREQRAGKLNWFGKVDGRPLPPGTYALTVRGEDRAGNLSPVTRGIRIRIRYVELPRETIRAVAGRRFAVRVDTDAKRVRWRLAGRSGTQRGTTLRLRAPRQPGGYTLFVTANGHGDRARIVVAAPRTP